MTTKTHRMRYGFYLVAFIDVLGQQDGLKKLANVPPSENNRDEIFNLLLSTASRVRTLRETFTDAFMTLPSHLRENAEKVSPQTRDHYLEFTSAFEFFHTGFSDAFVIGIPLFPDDRFASARNAMALVAVLHAIAYVALKAMGEWGIPIRGGVDVGVGVDLYPNEIFGPVTVSAYTLESKIADYPRIVIGSGLLNYVSWLEATQGSDWNAVKTRELAATCRRVVREAPDDTPMLHICGASVLRMALEIRRSFRN